MDDGRVTLDHDGERERTLRTGDALARAGLIAPKAVASADRVGAQYAIAIPPALAALIDPDDPNDPVARQFLPDARELDAAPDDRPDPIGDAAFSPVPGVVHRYPDRVLLKPVLVCPVYCRFCFRREAVGPGAGALDEAQMAAALGYIRDRREIREVILTGGDPLVMSDRRLAALVGRLTAIPHVEVLRVHTRVPVATPERITAALVEALAIRRKVLGPDHFDVGNTLAAIANNIGSQRSAQERTPDEMTGACGSPQGLAPAGAVRSRGRPARAETVPGLERPRSESRRDPVP